MSDAIIDVVGVDDLPMIVDMYNRIFRPARTVESFRRRYLGRHNILQLVARVRDKPAGFFLGFELKPDTFFAWFCGVVPEERRTGIGSQLMEAAHSWAFQHHYETCRLECHNSHRAMLHLVLQMGYDIVGTRWDVDRGDTLILFEKGLTSGH